jgi:hypothetical protein
MIKEKLRNKEVVVAVMNAKDPKRKKIFLLDNGNPIATFVKNKVDGVKQKLKALVSDVW